jgi:hypothetical protein
MNYVSEFALFVDDNINSLTDWISSVRTSTAQTYPETVSDEDCLENTEASEVKAAEPLLLEPFSDTFAEG